MALTASDFAGTSEGPYIGIGVGAYRADLSESAANASGSASITLGSDNFDVGASIFGGYRWNMGAG